MNRRMVGSELLKPGRITNIRRNGHQCWLVMCYYDDGTILIASFHTKEAAADFRYTLLLTHIQ